MVLLLVEAHRDATAALAVDEAHDAVQSVVVFLCLRDEGLVAALLAQHDALAALPVLVVLALILHDHHAALEPALHEPLGALVGLVRLGQVMPHLRRRQPERRESQTKVQIT